MATIFMKPRVYRLACLVLAIWASPTLNRPATAQDTYHLIAGQWVHSGTIDPDSPQGHLRHVRQLLAQDEPEQAHESVNTWIDQNPNNPLLPEALVLRGDALVAQEKYFKALFDYEQAIRQFPASEQFLIALEREYKVANIFASGVKRRFLGMRILSAAGEAEEIYIRIQERAPGSVIGEQASLALGDFFFDRSEMSSSAEAYDLFLINYPRSRFRERAMLRLIYANLATFKGPAFNPTGLIEAAQRIKSYQHDYPASAQRIGAQALLVRINESLAVKLLKTARWYEKTAQHISATYVYQRVVRDYPQTASAQQAIQRLRENGQPPLRPKQ